MRKLTHRSGLIRKVGVEMREPSLPQLPGQRERLAEIPLSRSAPRLKKPGSKIPDGMEPLEPAFLRLLHLVRQFFQRDPFGWRWQLQRPDIGDPRPYFRHARLHFRLGRLPQRENVQFKPLALQLENLIQDESLGKLWKCFQQVGDLHGRFLSRRSAPASFARPLHSPHAALRMRLYSRYHSTNLRRPSSMVVEGRKPKSR